MNKIRFETTPFLVAAFVCSACALAQPKARPAAAAPVVGVQPAPALAEPAADPPPAPSPVAMPTGKTHKLRGVVASVDAASGALTIRDRQGRARTLRIASGANLTKGGDLASISLSDVAAGDRVTLSVAGDVAAGVHVNVIAAKN